MISSVLKILSVLNMPAVYKSLHGLVPTPLEELIKQKIQLLDAEQLVEETVRFLLEAAV